MKNIIGLLVIHIMAISLLSCGHDPAKETTVSESTRTSLTYHDLALKDLDQMVHFVQRKIDESRAEKEDKIHPLKVGLRAVYSRPDDDAMIEKVVGPLRNEIDETDSWEHVISELVNESIDSMNNPTGTPAEQFTQVVFLQNVIAQNRPRVKEGGFAHDIIARIRDAHLTLSKQARNEGELRLMKAVQSPSDTAGHILGKEKKKAAEPEADEGE